MDRDLFQYERQRAVVSGRLLLVLAEGLAVVGVAVLVLMAHELIAGVHQNCHCLIQLHQQPQQTCQIKDEREKQILMTDSSILQIFTNLYTNRSH